METYIRQRQNTFLQYTVMQLILDLCKASYINQGAWLGLRWWEQAVIDLTGARETVVVEEGDKDGMEE